MKSLYLSTPLAFAIVSFFLGNLGDGLNIFQGIFLVNIGWNEGAIGIALSLMGLTSLVCQTFAGDAIDKTSFDRRKILIIASLMTSCSATTIMFVRNGNFDHMLMYITKIIEGIASSFIGPCLAALTLACNGPDRFDSTMANNVLWGHVGSATSAVLAGAVAYFLYPNIKYCFLVIGFSAVLAIFFIFFLPEGDRNLARGFAKSDESSSNESVLVSKNSSQTSNLAAATYLSVMSEPRTLILCLTGFFFHFANANVLLVLGELMSAAGNGDGDDGNGSASRSAIPLVGGAILLAQGTMSAATILGDKLTEQGVGRKVLFTAGLITLPLRCALIIGWKDSGNGFLLSTQILDGLGGGFFGLLHPYLVADITFGTGRFNLIMGLTASCFGLGGTMSNFLGQMVVEKFGHIISLFGSFFISFIPILIFTLYMPETLNTRCSKMAHSNFSNDYNPMA